MPTHPAIPRGRADLQKIRLEGCLYADKTRSVTLERLASLGPRPRKPGSWIQGPCNLS